MSRKNGATRRGKSQRFEVEQTMSATDAAAYLESLAGGLRAGTIALGQEGFGFHAAVEGDIALEVEARHRKKKSQVDLSLSFRAARPNNGDRPEADAPAANDGDEAPAPPATIPDEMSF